MDISFNKFKQRDETTLYLCNPNRDEIGVIDVRNRAITLRFNDLSELTFEIGEESPYYDYIESKRLVKVEDIGWFQITSVVETDNGTYKYKSVSTESHQTSLKNFGFYSEERTYCFYNTDDPYDEKYDSTDTSDEGVTQVPSVIGQLYQQGGIRVALKDDYSEYDATVDYDEWTIIYIPEPLIGSVSALTGTYRTFDDDSKYVYEFMTSDVGDAYGVVFDFDILHHAIKIKTINEITEKTNIYLSFDNLVQSIDVTEEADEIVTVLECNGDGVDITTVNPMGTNYLARWDYYKQIETDENGNVTYPWMTKDLITTLDNWEILYESKKDSYAALVQDYYDIYEQILPYEEEIEYNNLKITDITAVQDEYRIWYAETSGGTVDYDEDNYGATDITPYTLSEIDISYTEDSSGNYVASLDNQEVYSNAGAYEYYSPSYSVSVTAVAQGSIALTGAYLYKHKATITLNSTQEFNTDVSVTFVDTLGAAETVTGTIPRGSLKVTLSSSLMTGLDSYTSSATSMREVDILESSFTFYSSQPDISDGKFVFSGDSASLTLAAAYATVQAVKDGTSDTCYQYFCDDDTGKTYCEIKGTSVVDSDGNAQYLCGGYYRYCLAPYTQDGINAYNTRDSYITSVIGEEDSIDENTLYGQLNSIYSDMEEITNAVSIVKYFSNASNFGGDTDKAAELYRELKCYWIEGEYEDEYIAATDSTTMTELIELGQELMENGEEELEKVCQPRFSFEVSAINFLNLIDYTKFANDLELGKVITIQKDDGLHYYPALTEMSFSLDDPTDFTLTFSNAYKLNDWGFTIADLLNEASNTSRQVSSNWSDLMNYSKDKDTINNLLENTLDATLRYANANLYNQEFTIDTTGILGRKYTDDSQTSFGKEQIRLMNNLILFTDDGWETIRTALGKIVYSTDSYGNPLYAYGLAADVIVGDLIMSETLRVINQDNTVLIDDSGITILDSSETVVFSASSNGVYIYNYATTTDLTNALYDSDGNVIYATSTQYSTLSSTVDGLSSTVETISGSYVTSTTFTTAVNGVSARVSTIEKDYVTSGELALTIEEDDSGLKKAYLSGNADYISFNATKYITIDSPYFTLDQYGNINAMGGNIANFEIYESQDETVTTSIAVTSSTSYTVTSDQNDQIENDEGNQYTYAEYVGTINFEISAQTTDTIVTYKYTYTYWYEWEDDDGDIHISQTAKSVTGSVTIEAGETTGKVNFVYGNYTASSPSVSATAVCYATKKVLRYNKETYDDDNEGVYLGTDGIGLGAGTFYVDSSGFLYATDIYVEGRANLSELTVSDSTSFEGDVTVKNLSSNTINIGDTLGFNNSKYKIYTGSGGGTVTLTATLSGSKSSTATGTYYFTVTITDSSGSAYALSSSMTFKFSYYTYYALTGTFSHSASITIPAGSSSTTITETTLANYDLKNYYFTETSSTTQTWTEGGSYSGFFFNGQLIPTESGVYDLGASDYQWATVYSTSDKKYKTNIYDMESDFALKLINGLKPKKYEFIKKPGKEYYGLVAQDVEEVLIDLGVDMGKCGVVIKSFPNEPDGETNNYAISYDSFIAPIVEVIQYLCKEVENLKNKET